MSNFFSPFPQHVLLFIVISFPFLGRAQPNHNEQHLVGQCECDALEWITALLCDAFEHTFCCSVSCCECVPCGGITFLCAYSCATQCLVTPETPRSPPTSAEGMNGRYLCLWRVKNVARLSRGSGEVITNEIDLLSFGEKDFCVLFPARQEERGRRISHISWDAILAIDAGFYRTFASWKLLYKKGHR